MEKKRNELGKFVKGDLHYHVMEFIRVFSADPSLSSNLRSKFRLPARISDASLLYIKSESPGFDRATRRVPRAKRGRAQVRAKRAGLHRLPTGPARLQNQPGLDRRAPARDFTRPALLTEGHIFIINQYLPKNQFLESYRSYSI